MRKRNYELMFILKPNLSDEVKKKVVSALTSIIEKKGGNITNEEDWGRRELAYEIQKLKEGHYYLYNFEAPVDVPLELERKMRTTEEVIRWLIIKLDDEMKKPKKLEEKSKKRKKTNENETLSL